ncbi:MAG TPA: nitroreductase/quinone reductase family protein [Streptosporangiaceae bacterium]|nr:nitroreductase/quinone reductase family protein [Streptosporangiaceae bacterium]
MSSWPFSAEGLREMYEGRKANATARRFARLWSKVFGWGLQPKRWVTLEVPGRRTGRPARFPLGMADLDGQWYLVSMLGEGCNWVKNVRANGGNAVLWHGRAKACHLVEVPPEDRAPIIKRYLGQVPGGRPHIRVDRRAPLGEFEAIAPDYPVFRVTPVSAPASDRA